LVVLNFQSKIEISANHFRKKQTELYKLATQLLYQFYIDSVKERILKIVSSEEKKTK